MQNPPLAAFYHFEANWKAIIAHSRYWSIKWYGGRCVAIYFPAGINQGFNKYKKKAWRPPLQCRQWSVHCLGDTNTCGIRYDYCLVRITYEQRKM